jgi:hypothetical protein
MSFTSKVIVDPDGQSLTLENYAAAPVLLTNARRGVPAAKPDNKGTAGTGDARR